MSQELGGVDLGIDQLDRRMAAGGGEAGDGNAPTGQLPVERVAARPGCPVTDAHVLGSEVAVDHGLREPCARTRDGLPGVLDPVERAGYLREHRMLLAGECGVPEVPLDAIAAVAKAIE